MQIRQFVRAFAALAVLSSGACDTARSPTAVEAPAAPRFNTYPGPGWLTVTNSGGHPLISWNAAPGATSYTVRLITFFTQNGQYTSRAFSFLANTTGTSYLDTGHDYTGVYECSMVDDMGMTYGYWYEYSVQAHYPNGSSSMDYSRHFAPITNEGCYF